MRIPSHFPRNGNGWFATCCSRITRMDGWTEQPIVVGSSRAHKAIHHGPAITTVPDPRDPGSLPALTVPVPVGGTCYRTKRMIRCHSRECRLVIGNLPCVRGSFVNACPH